MLLIHVLSQKTKLILWLGYGHAKLKRNIYTSLIHVKGELSNKRGPTSCLALQHNTGRTREKILKRRSPGNFFGCRGFLLFLESRFKLKTRETCNSG